MLTEQIERYYTNNRNRVLGASTLLLTLIWVYSGLFTQRLPIEETILFVVLLASFSLELASKELTEINETVSEPPTLQTIATELEEIHTELEAPTVFESARTAVPYQSDYIEEVRPEEVHFLEYNSTTVREGVFETAADNGCRINLLIKDPTDAISKRQRENIINSLQNIFEAYYDMEGLTIHFYRKPASVKGRRFGGDLVSPGWYTFEHRDTNRENPIWGGDNPMVCVRRDLNPGQFHALDTWFQNIYHDLWTTGRSPEALYLSDDCPARLEQWASIGEEQRQWLQQVSGDTDISRQELFE